jgi:hypothetical protein
VVLVLGLLAFIITTTRSYLRLKAFKGPRIAGFSNVWVFSCTLRGNLNEKTAELLKKDGTFTQLVVLNNNHLLKRQDHSCELDQIYS